MLNRSLPARYAVFAAGLVFSALGISLITKAGLGTSPVSSLAYVLTFIFPLSMGTFTLVTSLAMLAAQILILRREFERVQLLQIPISLVFSALIDLFLFLFSSWATPLYFQRIAVLLAGCVALGLGVALQVLANVLVIASEGLVKAIAGKLRWEFGTAKTTFDVLLVTISAALSLACLGRVAGIREGTLVAAITVGSISRFFRKRFEKWLERSAV